MIVQYSFEQLFTMVDGDRGKNYPKDSDFSEEGYCLFLNAGNVTSNGWSFEDKMFISKEKDEILNKGKVSKGDLIITTRGTVGNVVLYNERVPFENVRINSGMLILKINNEEALDNRFAYYLLISPYVKKIISLFCSGSAQPQLPVKDFKKIKVNLPSIDFQRKTAFLLYSFDLSIENNTKRIKLLEKMAENLYKEWFARFRFPGHEGVEFENGLPMGWVYTTIEDLSEILQRGISPQYDDDGEYTVISQKCIRTSVVDFSESRHQTKKYKSELNLQDADIVICSTGTGTLGRVGKVIGNYPNTTFDSHVTLVRAKAGISKQYLYSAIKNMQVWLENMGVGSTNQQELNRKTIKNAKIVLPDENTMKRFEEISKCIHDEIGSLIASRDNLTKQRDLLLPRLMSGKLEVK